MDYLGQLKGELVTISKEFDYIRATANFKGLKLFPMVYTENLKVAIYDLVEGHDVPVMAFVHAFDSEAHIADRPDYVEIKTELLLIKEKINQGEALRKKINDFGMSRDENMIIKAVYNDINNLFSRILTRLEVMTLELMCTGKITITEQNLNKVIDQHIPESHYLTLNGWSTASTNILGDLVKIKKNNNNIIRAYTSNTVMGYILNNTQLNKIATDSKVFLNEDFAKEFLKTRLGIEFVVIDEKYKTSINGQKLNAFKDDVIVFTTTDGTLGATFMTNTPSEDLTGTKIVGKNSYIVIDQWIGNDPKTLWTEASAVGIPVIQDRNSIYICTVNE